MFTAMWISWLAAFVVIEGAAIKFKGTPATLSAHVWAWFAVPRYGSPVHLPTNWERARRIFLLAFMAWLTVHFVTGGTLV